jgi:hypothetical protein
MAAYFEPVPYDKACAYCSGHRPVTPLPPPLDAVYCISLQDQPHRTRSAIEHFHQIGLCRHVTLYRPVREANPDRAIWGSHRAAARDAVAKACRSALILEDDVVFRQDWSAIAPKIARGMSAAPATWWSLYLGHFPLQAYFVRTNVMRTRSALTHAYIANAPLLAWFENTEPLAAEAPVWGPLGSMIDSALSLLPEMYALFPMVVLQRYLGDYRVDARVDETGRRRAWNDVDRWRYYLIFRGVLVAQAAAVALSPFHWLTLEFFRKRRETPLNRAAKQIRAAGFADDGFYCKEYPDVAAGGIDPLRHYLNHGAAEGRRPYLLFDPQYYAAQGPDLDGKNPLLHFIQVGAKSHRDPHPLFDTDFYLSRYADRIPQGMNALAHFLKTGGLSGCDPHPLFDTAWYLARHPDVRQRPQNPLVHYLIEGWRSGFAPHLQFDGELYLTTNPDVKAAGANPLEHYVRHGQFEGRAQPIPPA